MDYDKINAYYFFPESCFENCTQVTEAESDYVSPNTIKQINEALNQKSEYDFDVDLDLFDD